MSILQTVTEALIQEKWPHADRVQYAGQCPNCRAHSSWSFVIPEWDLITWDGAYQMCGYFCTNCQWSNAGAREISQLDTWAHGGGEQGEP